MGRALMVGRGPTGAGLPLVLPILVVLAARSCRAQKGWLVGDSGANLTELTAATRRPTRPPPLVPSSAVRSRRCLHVSVHRRGGKSTTLRCCRPTKLRGGKPPYTAVDMDAELRTVHAAVMRACLAQRNRANRFGSNREYRVHLVETVARLTFFFFFCWENIKISGPLSASYLFLPLIVLNWQSWKCSLGCQLLWLPKKSSQFGSSWPPF